jgi:hypothetical protein
LARQHSPAPPPAAEKTAPVGKITTSEKASTAEQTPSLDWDPLAQPIEVLPGKWLMAMNKVIGGNTNSATEFRVWGEIIAYAKRNYILPTSVATYSLFGPRGADESVSPTLRGPTSDSSPATAKPAVTTEEQTETAAELPEHLRETLLAMPRTAPLSMPSDQSASRVSDASLAASAAEDAGSLNRKDGDLIVDRVGRMIYDANEQGWLFSFDSDSQTASEPPVILHPCRLLEVMENTVHQSVHPLRFRISGQITRYQGRTYLLLRKMLIVHDLGNLSK